MNRNLILLSGRYAEALRKHLKQDPWAGVQRAQGLGRQALALGLETLDLARIHERALASMNLSNNRSAIFGLAESFFAEVITPIEKTHRAALASDVRLNELNKKLNRRTVALASSHLSLKEGIVQRKSVEQALKKSGQRSKTLLKESNHLQKQLQRLTHRILSAQEDRRKKISSDLKDEIAQTLLGINVRLLTLKKEAAVDAENLKKEIAGTQRLVDMSVRRIKRFARAIGNSHEA